MHLLSHRSVSQKAGRLSASLFWVSQAEINASAWLHSFLGALGGILLQAQSGSSQDSVLCSCKTKVLFPCWCQIGLIFSFWSFLHFLRSPPPFSKPVIMGCVPPLEICDIPSCLVFSTSSKLISLILLPSSSISKGSCDYTGCAQII